MEYGIEKLYPTFNDTKSYLIFNVVTYGVGISASGIALTLLISTAILFKEWRQSYKNQLLIQFMISRFIYSLVGCLNDVFYPLVTNSTPSHISWFFQSYTELALVMWMYTFTRHMHHCLVNIFGYTDENIVTVSLCSWIFPLFTTSVLILFSFMGDSPKISLKCLLFYIILIKWPIIFANAILLCLILKSILNNNFSRTKSNKRIVHVMIIMIFVYCVQQILCDSQKILFLSYLYFRKPIPDVLPKVFSILNSISLYYCPISILFWVFGNKKTRMLWSFKRRIPSSVKHSRISII